MVIAQLHSTEPRRRSQAVGVLGTYDMDTPGIGDALRSAAADPDPEVSRHASMTMKQMLRKQNENGRRDVQFPDEPNYDGQTLGEWLKMRQGGWELTTTAAAALRHMGTNAIHPLLARLAYKEPVFGLYDFDVSMEAVGGLLAMGEQAKPALPVLAALMDSDDQDLAVRAMMATLGTEADAIPYVMRGLTNRFPDVRNEAASLLAGEWGARFTEQRKQVVPFLVKLLNDPDQHVRMNATNELKELDPQAAIKAGIK